MNERINDLNNKYREILAKAIKNTNVDTYIFGIIYQKVIEDFLISSKEKGFKTVAINYPALDAFKDGLKKEFKVKILDINDVIDLTTDDDDKAVLNHIKEISIYETFK